MGHYFRLVSAIGLGGTVAALALYHLVLRRRRADRYEDKRNVRRFSFLERLAHLVAIISLLTLSVTGFAAALNGKSLDGTLWLVHFAVAPVFAVAVAVIAMIWAKDGHLELYDLKWLIHLGGYLWKKDGLPAGRFNAGQKKFFWFVAVFGILLILSGLGRMYPVFGETGQEILYQVHRYAALLLVMGVVAHLYLGTLANPGTLWAMISGYVSSEWAAHHHPNWWETVDKGDKTEEPES